MLTLMIFHVNAFVQKCNMNSVENLLTVLTVFCSPVGVFFLGQCSNYIDEYMSEELAIKKSSRCITFRMSCRK